MVHVKINLYYAKNEHEFDFPQNEVFLCHNCAEEQKNKLQKLEELTIYDLETCIDCGEDQGYTDTPPPLA